MSEPFSWPNDLVEQATSHNLILVVGAGVSHACQNDLGESPPLWPELILEVAKEVHLHMTRLPELQDLVDRGRLLDAAELLKLEARNSGHEQAMVSKIRTLVDGRSGHSFAGGKWHEAIWKLGPNIIVTTNYDKILERATLNGYATHDYKSSTVAPDIRRGEPVLLKIHGSVDNMESVILSRRDYTSMRLNGGRMMDALHALFLTRPALLVGYSFGDPDLQLVLENVLGGREETPSHYLMCEDSIPDYELEILRFSYGISPIRYPAGQYSVALSRFSELADLVSNTDPASVRK